MSEYEEKDGLLPSRIEKVRFDKDDAMPMVTWVIGGIVLLILLLCVILPCFSGLVGFELESWGEVLSSLDYQWWVGMGLGIVITFSVMGGTWGISLTGASIMGSAIRSPRVTTKNLISIVFCEAVGIYGLIMAIILALKFRFGGEKLYNEPAFFYQIVAGGYILFAAGVCVGMGNLACGISIGICGSSCVIADAADKELFVRVLVVEIFASAIGIFAIIVGIVFQFSKLNF